MYPDTWNHASSEKMWLSAHTPHSQWNLTSNLCSENVIDDQLLSILVGKTCDRVSALTFLNTVSHYSWLLVHALLDVMLRSAHVVRWFLLPHFASLLKSLYVVCHYTECPAHFLYEGNFCSHLNIANFVSKGKFGNSLPNNNQAGLHLWWSCLKVWRTITHITIHTHMVKHNWCLSSWSE